MRRDEGSRDEGSRDEDSRAGEPAARPDIELTTSVRADRLRFRDRPETEVRFHGSPGRDAVSGAERTNLPKPVEPGTAYQDVQVDYRLATSLRQGDDRRLREALGAHGSGEPEDGTGPRPRDDRR